MREAATQILSNWRVQTTQQLCDGLNLLLDNAGETLVDFAAKTESVDLQTTFFDAQHLLAMQGDKVLAGFRDELEQAESEGLSHKPAPGSETLSLLERDAYERSVALETIANNCILRNQQNFHALKQRLSAIYSGRKFQVDNLPLNPKRVANSFESAIEILDISSKARLVLFTLFDRYVMNRLDTALSDINQQLAEAGILPTVKYTVRKQASPESSAASAAPSPAPFEEGDDARQHQARGGSPAAEGVETGPEAAPSAEQTMRDITQLVSAQRRRQRYKEISERGGVAPPPVPPQESRRRALEALNSPQLAQQTPNVAPQILTARDNKIVIDKELLLRVRNTLKKQRALINSLMGGSKNVGEREQNAIDIVGMLFEAMLDDQTIPDQLKALLSHLHTPYLKIAVKDPKCLTDTDHPSRKLLGQMLQLGIRWVDPERLRSGIYPTLQYCVRKIIDSPENIDYHELEGELERKSAQLEQAKQVSEKRTLEAEKGKTMLARARDTAESATQALLQTHGLPAGVRVFLQTVFTDYMSLLLLRNDLDPNRPDCKKSLAAAVKLIENVDTQDIPSALQAGEQLKQFIITLLPHYQDKIDRFLSNLDTTIAHTDDEQVEEIVLETSAAEKEPPAIDEAAAAHVLQIPAGSWFWLQENPTEQPLMVKLLWANPHTRHVLFVDQHGQKRARMTLEDAASKFDNKILTPVEAHPEGVFGRLLTSIKQRLESTLATGTHS